MKQLWVDCIKIQPVIVRRINNLNLIMMKLNRVVYQSECATRKLGHMVNKKWMKSVLFFLLISHSLYAENTQSFPFQCKSNCNTQYGVELGTSPSGIPAYSNCSSNCVVYKANYIEDIYTGIKWQCVEYARRWLLSELNVVFGDVDIAAQIWNLDNVTNPINGKQFQFESMVNGSKQRPKRGDLLVYGKEYLGTGHVAVIVSLDEKEQTIKVAEQNYFNLEWGGNFARKISYLAKDEQYWILDGYLIGWKRVMHSLDAN